MQTPERTGGEKGAGPSTARPLSRKTSGDKALLGGNHGRRSSSAEKSKQRESLPEGTRNTSLQNTSPLPPPASSTTPDPRKNRKRKASADKVALSAEDRASSSTADEMEGGSRKKAGNKPRRERKTQDEGPIANLRAENIPETFEEWCKQDEYAMCFTVAKTTVEPGRSTESTGENLFIADGFILTGIAICWDEDEAHYFPLDIVDPLKLKKQFGTKNSVIVEDVHRALSFLARPCSLNPANCGWKEPKLANWLLDPDKGNARIPDLVKQWVPDPSDLPEGEVTGPQSISQPDLSEDAMISKNKRRSQVRVDAWQENVVSGEVARKQAVLVWKLQKALVKKLKEEEMYDLYRELVVPVLGLHCKIILNGIGCDPDNVLDAVSSAQQDLYTDLKKDIKIYIGEGADEEYDLSKPTEVTKLITKLVPPDKLENMSLQNVWKDDSLTKISKELNLQECNDYTAKIRDWRKMNRIYTKLRKISDKSVGNLICCLSQTWTVTGRISTCRPNLQFIEKNVEVCTLPVRTIKARAAFKPSEGAIFLSADYSQLELRILAHLSEDKGLRNVFIKRGDVFRLMAALWNKCREEHVDDTLRSQTKQICYSILYGAGIKSIANKLDISHEEAERMMKQFEAAFPGVDKYRQRLLRDARASVTCAVRTLRKRRRFLPNLNIQDYKKKGKPERQVLSAVIQGSAADVFWTALLAIDEALGQKLLRSGQQKEGGTYMVLQVHDEVLLEVREDDFDKVSEIVRKCMEGVKETLGLSVPFPVRMRKGYTWGDMEDI